MSFAERILSAVWLSAATLWFAASLWVPDVSVRVFLDNASWTLAFGLSAFWAWRGWVQAPPTDRALHAGLLAFALLAADPALAREVVDASAPKTMSVTVYRDPERGEGDAMNRDWPQGFAMISETRTVTLPPGESTIRFEGVAEGMVGVSAIVTGLPGGTIEKNRNAQLLSPAAIDRVASSLLDIGQNCLIDTYLIGVNFHFPKPRVTLYLLLHAGHPASNETGF